MEIEDMPEEDEAQLRRLGRYDLVNKGVCGKAALEQVGGNHYKSFAIQPWDIIDEYNLSFYEGNVLKYLLRHKHNRLEDLQKARHYLDKVIEDYKDE